MVSRFYLIDDKITNLANRLNARLTKDRPNYPDVLRTFEERRIDWNDNKINKAIIIQPNFEATGVNSSIWNFINIAWHDDAHSAKRPKWINILVDKSEFEVIEKNIDKLLFQSEENLKKIKMEDLK
ncbi:MAG: hypothetical protein EOP48_19790 [Sphingobacteriales bacterium]|nr:MAG: hypothetical protein EOP48_19790 [Sphingobacteriales bacterium]